MIAVIAQLYLTTLLIKHTTSRFVSISISKLQGFVESENMSPWGKVTNPEPVMLQDIMSEEVAKDLQAKEKEKYVQSLCDGNCELEAVVDSEVLQLIARTDGEDDSDAVIARMLQRQFDEEYDKMLKIKEQKCNGDSKVSISFTNYRRVPQTLGKTADDHKCLVVLRN